MSVRTQVLSRDAVLAWLVVALVTSWAGYFLFTGMPQLTLHVFPRTLVLHAMAGGAAIVYLASLAIRRRLPGGTPIDHAVLALIAAFAIATYESVNWRASLEASLQLSIAIAAFYVISGAPFVRASHLRRGFMLAMGALAIYTLWVVGNDYADYLRLANAVEGLHASNIFPATVPRVHDVSDNPNILAMVLVLAMPFFALAAYRPASIVERLGGIAGLFAGGWALFLTLSRGGWAGAAVAVSFALVAAWLTVRADERERSGEPLRWDTFVPSGISPTAIATILGAFALIVFGTLAFLASSSTRPGWLFRGSLSPREDAWHVGRQIFNDHLLTGAGPNTFGLLYPAYSKHAAEFIVHTQHAHNGFLQLADDAGVIGLLALVVLAIAVVFMLFRVWRAGTLEQRLTAVACAGALLGFSLHNQLDAGNIWKAPGVALAFVGAILARSYLELPAEARRMPALRVPDAVTRYVPMAARVGLLLLVVVPLAGWYKIDKAHHEYWVGMEMFNDGEPGALPHLQKAVNADSSMMPYQMELGVAQAAVYDGSGRTDSSLIAAAVVHLERAIALDPDSDLARANLARAYQLGGRAEDAAGQAQVTRLSTYHVAPVLVAGSVYEDLGQTADAISTYGQVISMDAGLANSTYWERTQFRRDHLAEILNASTIGINPCTLGAYLVEAHRSALLASGNADAADDADVSFARPRLEQAANDCQFLMFTGNLANDLALRVNLARILLTLHQDQEALGHLEYAVTRQPDYGPARTELGYWYAKQRNITEARHQWVVGGQLDEAASVRHLGDSYNAADRPAELRGRLAELLQTTGSSIQNDIVSVLYFRMRYGRLSPVSPLVPGDWQTAVPRPYAEMQDALARWERDAGG
jgi:O-antigen ligase/tetratricopeptide (TPR) repeat protein